jgi:hypothetical protein
LKWREELKLFFENRLPPGAEAGAYMTAAANDFLNLLAAEVREDRGRHRLIGLFEADDVAAGSAGEIADRRRPNSPDIRRNTTSLDSPGMSR